MGELSQKALKEVRITFDTNPAVEEFHVTTDGLCFTNESEAANHGHSLTHGLVNDAETGELRKMEDHEKDAVREVFVVKRSDLDKKEPKAGKNK